MNKIQTKHDLNITEPTYFRLVLSTSFLPEEIRKLKDLGGELKYDGGLSALIIIPPTKLEEFCQLETVLSVFDV